MHTSSLFHRKTPSYRPIIEGLTVGSCVEGRIVNELQPLCTGIRAIYTIEQ